MGTVNVIVTDGFEASLAEAAQTAGFADVGAYVESLVRADRKKRAIERLERLALEALDSGPAYDLTDEVWARIDADFQRRLETRRTATRE